MKYILICLDGKDKEAEQRRAAVRQQHLDEIQKNPHFFFGTAILEDEKMVGSVMVMDFENEQQLEEYLSSEIYVTGKVWQDIKKIPCADGFIGPALKES